MDDLDAVRAHVGKTVDVALHTHYGHHRLSALDGLEELDARERDYKRDAFVDDVCRQIRGAEVEGRDATSFLAWLCIVGSTFMHTEFCPRGKSRARVCAKDAAAIEDVMQGLAMSLFRVECRTLLGKTLESAVNAKDVPADERIAAVAAQLQGRLYPHRGLREPLPIEAERPTIQFNAPIQFVFENQFEQNRALMQSLAQVAEANGFWADVTSDYAPPGGENSSDVWAVRSDVLRSAANVVLQTGGSVGTGQTLALAFVAAIPTLRLAREDDDVPSINPSRYDDGHLKRFRNGDEAVEIFEEFLRTNGERILRRHRMLCAIADRPSSPEFSAMVSADPAIFTNASFSYREAQFWSQPVHWEQAPAHVRAEISKLLGTVAPTQAQPQTSPVPAMDPGAMSASVMALFAFGVLMGIEQDRLRDLWSAYQAESVPGPRARKAATGRMAVEDWAALHDRLP